MIWWQYDDASDCWLTRVYSLCNDMFDQFSYPGLHHDYTKGHPMTGLWGLLAKKIYVARHAMGFHHIPPPHGPNIGLGPKILRSWKLNGSTHPKNAIFHPKDATQTSVEGVHRVPISIRTYGVLGPSEENVLHTNNADPRVQDNPSFSTQMVSISKIKFSYTF